MISMSNPESTLSRNPLSSSTRVVVFHNQPLVADGLAILLSADEGIEVTGITSRSSNLIDAICRSQPHVVVFGFPALGQSRPDVMISRAWTASMGRRPSFVVIVSSDQNAEDALAIDALAVVTTDVTGQALRDLVRTAHTGGSRRVPLEFVRPAGVRPTRVGGAVGTGLTARESEVLRGIENGLSTKEISRDLGISVNTTRTHAQRLMSKLRVHSRLQAAAIAADQPHLATSARRRT